MQATGFKEDDYLNESTLEPLNKKGLIRVQTILKHIDCSPTTWWRWVKKGIAPQPINIDGGGTYWKTEEILYFIENGKVKR